MIRRLIAAATIAATFTAAGTAQAADVDTFRVVGTGDSILSRVHVAGMLDSADRWFNTEPGREVYNPGVRGESSHIDMWDDVVARSRPGGYVIFQDDGTRATPDEWAVFVQWIVDTLPDDRCLIGIPPYYDPAIHPGNGEYTAVSRQVMADTFAQQPCHVMIDWPATAAAHPEFLEDGVHPNAAGQEWLAAAIDALVGSRVP